MLIKSYLAGAAIPKYRVVKFGLTDGSVILGGAVVDALIGVVDIPSTAILNDRVDVVREGITLVEYGGIITRGDLLTIDAVGRVITSAPAVGVAHRIIGIAEVSGVLGDVAYMNINICVNKG